MENAVDRPVLLIEDNQGDEELTLIALRQAKIANDVRIARTGEEALQYLCGENDSGEPYGVKRPAVVLLDLSLPGMSGLEVLRRIRADERTKLLPVVVFTASRQDNDVLLAYELGANSYIRKPNDFNSFAYMIKQMFLYWLIMNEPAPAQTVEPT
jgi:two-component system response regulator